MKRSLNYFLIIFGTVASITTLGLALFDKTNLNQLNNVLMSGIITLLIIIYGIYVFKSKQSNNGLNTILSVLLVVLIGFNMCSTFNLIPERKQDTIKDFTNTNLNDFLLWANDKGIEIVQTYEFSDTIPKYHIISQSVIAGTPLDSVKKLELVISDGPNYDKSIIVPNMLGWSVSDVEAYIATNYLSNVEVLFSFSDETKHTVIKQSKSGDMRRNDQVTLEFSLGTEADLTNMDLIDFTNMTTFKATLWLKMYGFKYNLTYEFSDTVARNTVISQKEEVGKSYDPKTDSINLVISKGKQIVVPNLMNMKMEDITKWIMDNKLSVNFSDQYHETIALGNVIEVNVKENDIIEEGALIKVVTSRGQLKMEEFNSLAEFRTWANKYGIKYRENYEFSNQPSGTILKMNVTPGTAINIKEEIVLTISQGKSITIPNYSGKSKKDIEASCKSLGLRCSFTYGGYSNVALDYATGQNKRAGLEVISGTSLTITLSRGVATTKTLVITQSILGKSFNATKTALQSYFANNYPGVSFNYVAKAQNSLAAGLIHPDSPVRNGMSITQGQTYTIWIVAD